MFEFLSLFVWFFCFAFGGLEGKGVLSFGVTNIDMDLDMDTSPPSLVFLVGVGV